MRKKKEELIAPDKFRNVIHLEKRGREKPNLFPPLFCVVMAVLCFAYCAAIFLFIGYGTKFFLIWGVIGAFFLALALLIYRKDVLEFVPVKIKMTVAFLVGVGLFFFAFTEIMIVRDFTAKKVPAEADYLIVLGAQWKNNGPSMVLKYRLDKAITYLNENPDTKVIVSGGQGYNEPITEAKGMANYLEEHGVQSERIYLEEASTNTEQNLLYSGFLLEPKTDTVIIVTNNFHVFRATGIAKKQGYKKVYGLPASSVDAMLPNNLLREFFGVCKDTLFGNMKYFH